VIGIDGSPSCDAGMTCRGPWGGEFRDAHAAKTLFAAVEFVREPGVFLQILQECAGFANVRFVGVLEERA